MNKFKPYLEILVFFVVMYTFGLLFRPEDPFFNDLKPCPYIVIVVIGAVKYGSPVGLILGIICSILDFGTSIIETGESLRDAIFLDPYRLLPIAVYIALGHFIGESIHSRIKRSEYFKKMSDDNKKLADTLSGERADLENRYRQLESKIAAESKSNYSFIKYLMKFDTLEFNMIGEYVSDLLNKFFSAKYVEYWIKKGTNWERVYPETDKKNKVDIPALILKSEEINDWATCRDYPELAANDGVDLAMCFISSKTHAHHAVTCRDIPFTEWGIHLEDRIRTILRESTAAFDFWDMKFALNEATPIEQKLRVESLTLFKNHVNRQLLTLRRSSSISSLLFICVDEEFAKNILVLSIISSCLRTLLRVSDSLSFVQEGNYFVLFLPQTPLEGAKIVMKKINQAIDGLELKPKNKDIRLQPAYYELTNANMMDEAFADFRKEMLV